MERKKNQKKENKKATVQIYQRIHFVQKQLTLMPSTRSKQIQSPLQSLLYNRKPKKRMQVKQLKGKQQQDNSSRGMAKKQGITIEGPTWANNESESELSPSYRRQLAQDRQIQQQVQQDQHHSTSTLLLQQTTTRVTDIVNMTSSRTFRRSTKGRKSRNQSRYISQR